MLKTGTLADRLAAIIVRVQESPLHRLSYMATLMAMAQKKGKRESLLAVGAYALPSESHA